MAHPTEMPADSLNLPRSCVIPAFMRAPARGSAQGANVTIVGLPSDSGGPTARETLAFVQALAGLSAVGANIVDINPLYDGRAG